MEKQLHQAAAWRAKKDRVKARRHFAMYKAYKDVEDHWHAMKLRMERLALEVNKQHQNSLIAQTFSKANEAMAELTKQLNMETLTQMIDDYEELVTHGKEVDELLSVPGEEEVDDVELDAYLDDVEEKKSPVREKKKSIVREKKKIATFA
jgi:myosin heavy subunit